MCKFLRKQRELRSNITWKKFIVLVLITICAWYLCIRVICCCILMFLQLLHKMCKFTDILCKSFIFTRSSLHKTCNDWVNLPIRSVNLHLCHVNIYPSYIYRLFAQSLHSYYVSELQRLKYWHKIFSVHNVVRFAAFMKLNLHGLILSTRSYQSENLFALEISFSCFDLLLLDGTL